MQALGTIPGGPLLVHLLGRMTPDGAIAGRVYGKWLASPIGLAGGVDPDGLAIGAFGRLGFGFVEVGPYAVGAAPGRPVLPVPLLAGVESDRLAKRLRARPVGLSVWLRIAVAERDAHCVSGAERLLNAVGDAVDVVCVTITDGPSHPECVQRDELWRCLVGLIHQHGIATVLADFPIGAPQSAIETAFEAGVAGVVLRAPAAGGLPLDTAAAIRRTRQQAPTASLVVAACGARSPREIRDAFRAGAGLVALDLGVIESGPGIAKRGNEALPDRRPEQPPALTRPLYGHAWPWLLLLGVGMFVAGAVVFWVGQTRVVLGYDEAFLGIGRDAFPLVNPRLLGFMRHDRITLAGTLMSIGLLYAALAWFGVRQGQRWARGALLGSGTVGFASLFLFLGFRYVDPLHVVLSAGLFPPFLIGMALPMRQHRRPSLDLDNDSSWRRGLVGQLLFIGLGAGLVGAGLTIATVGVTRVFVFADLQFLETTSAAISAANGHLLPLIAHDRAGFGGALASDGLAVLLLSLWGFRRGERWVWWTLCLAGLSGLACGVYAHIAVGYLEIGHLLPLLVSALVFSMALALSGPYMLAGNRNR
jgi:hypothetical protein